MRQRQVYAAGTTVPPQKTRAEIEHVLTRYGARGFGSWHETGRAVVVFEIKDRRVRFSLDTVNPQARTQAAKDQSERQRWRALLLCIKSKLEAVESKIETLEEAFLPHIVMPDGMTVGERMMPGLQKALTDNKLPPLLPGPTTTVVGELI